MVFGIFHYTSCIDFFFLYAVFVCVFSVWWFNRGHSAHSKPSGPVLCLSVATSFKSPLVSGSLSIASGDVTLKSPTPAWFNRSQGTTGCSPSAPQLFPSHHLTFPASEGTTSFLSPVFVGICPPHV